MKKLFILILLIYSFTPGFSQSVGIGTATPAASSLLHVDIGANDTKGFLVTGDNTGTATVPDLGTGSRLMFYPGKSAFRAGMGIFPNWNNANVGYYSIGMGVGTLASGQSSVALGNQTKATGGNATALGYLSTASGNYTTAFGYNSLASGLYSFSSGINTISSGTWSVSFGTSTQASGVGSFAVGGTTIAAGSYSVAMGNTASANGYSSLAMGDLSISNGYMSKALGSNAKALGGHSSSLGLYTVAKGYGTTVIGMYNDSVLTTDQIVNAETYTPLFIVGNGNLDNLRSNAMLVEKGGNVAIGNIVPAASAQLHVDLGTSTTKGVLLSGAFNAASTVPDLGAGSRMMFYPGKAAFRVGRVSANQWNNAEVGPMSVAMGENTIASGSNSTAIGVSTVASGDYAMSMGYFSKAKGFASTVIGLYNDSVLTTNQTAINSSTPLFIVGNGNDLSTRSNAMLVEKNGNVAIGNIVPAASAQLHVDLGTSISKGVLFTGAFNAASTVPDLGAGSRMMFYPARAAFRAGRVTGNEWNDANVGPMSVAMGQGTMASGAYATALGYQSVANNSYSTAMGANTAATGFVSMAMGASTIASGDYSMSMGYFSKAKGYASTVIGLYNDSILTTNQTAVNSSTPLFIVGNGNDASTRSNALLVEKSGNVAIGNIIPAGSALLHVDVGTSTSKGILVTGNFNAASTLPDLGASSRMMFYPGKSALRAGRVDGTQWNNANVGHSSVALGTNTIAAGSYSTAIGYQTLANANYTTGIGVNSSAIGFQSLAIGNSNTANGEQSMAMGAYSRTGGAVSSTLGIFNRAKGYASTVLGMFNDSILLADQLAVSASTPLFIVGNGNDDFNRSNAMVVRKDGNVGIGISAPSGKVQIKSVSTVTTPQILLDENSTGYARLGFKNTLSANSWNIAGLPNTSNSTAELNFYYEGIGNVLILKGNGNATLTGTLTENSDARLKKNIVPIGSSLKNLMKLNGYQYNWKDENRDKEIQLGVIAQEVKAVFPELVKEDEKGILSVNYSGLIPVLINAVKEQQQQMEVQKNLIKKLEERLNNLEKVK